MIGSYIYFFTAIVSLATGMVMLVVNPYRMVNRAFCFSSVWIALWFFSVSMAIRTGALNVDGAKASVLFWLKLNAILAALLVWLMWMLRAALLRPRDSVRSIIYRSSPWFCVSCLIGSLAFTEMFVSSRAESSTAGRGSIYFVYMGSLAVCAFIFLVDAMRQMHRVTGIRRIEMQFFVFNTSCACLLMIALNTLGSLFNIVWLRRVGPLAFIALYGLTIWAICSYKVFDAKQVVCSIAQRALLIGLLTGTAILSFLILDGALARPLVLIISAFFTGILAVGLERPMRKWFGVDPERLLMAPRRAIIGCAREESDAETLRHRFQQILGDWCGTKNVVLLMARGGVFAGANHSLDSHWHGLNALVREGWLTPEALQRKRPERASEMCARWMADHDIGALIAVPHGSDRPSFLVALGFRENGRPYTYPDIRIVATIAELMDNILTHATLAQHAAKIAQLEAAALISRSLAHDLNNLTTPVASYLLHAEGRATAGTPEAEVYDSAMHSVKVMNAYIRESLFFSRRLVPNVMMMDPMESLLSVTRLVKDRARHRNITVEVHGESGIRLQADPVLFQRLASNLVNNAIDASPDHASVRVVVENTHADHVCLLVENSGEGIAAENLRRVFDPYFTTKNTGDLGRGLGLGLAICRKIVDLHGGEIEADSTPGERTIFRALFPRKAKVDRRSEFGDLFDRDITKSVKPSSVVALA